MHYVYTVHVVHGHQDLLDDVDSLGFCKVTLVFQLFFEISALDKLHHNVIVVRVLYQLYDFDDMSVVHLCNDIDLI